MKKYAVDVHLDFARCYEIEAESREDAERKVRGMFCGSGFDPLKEGFEQTGDSEIRCSGEADDNGEIVYFS